jgi:LPXTG-site transpeptidase (sortase) family protein
VGQLFNFSIQITNNGTAPASNAFLTDSFPSVLTVTGAQTNKGTYTINTASNTITFTIGNINPNETVRVGVLAQVNNTAVANTNYTNSATLSFRIDTVNQSRTSNSVSYRIIGTSTLPGTGLAQIDDNQGNATFRTIALSITVLLAFLGLVVLIVGLRARKQQSAWSTWLTRMALIMIGAALVFGLATWGLSLPSQSVVDSSPLVSSSTPVIVSWHADPENLSFEMLLPTPTPDTLPDYQVPTPDTDSENSESADTSPIQQLMVPALGLDAVVKYVPYDGYTWQIAGLKQEIAWLGETSWPGLGKNTGLAGHVTLVDGTDGPFRYLADLRTGDVVTVYTEENIYSYTVREQAVVSDSELSVLEPTDESQLTLITCTNWNKDLKLYLDRLVVFADLDKVEPIQQANLGN